MNGRPVWLVSVSLRRSGRIRATGTWNRRQFAKAEYLAHRVLDGVGDSGKERAFRMNVTFCIHRAVTGDEERGLPEEWDSVEGGVAGPPVEVLWSRGIEHTLASLPCRSPGRQIIDEERDDLWIPAGCGECDVCEARAAA